MKNLIYYPTFEPQELNWLKYALVYIEEFSPIIPVRGKKQLSDIFRKIEGETELINTVVPDWRDGEKATVNALREIEQIRKFPEAYKNIFNRDNIIDTWINPINWKAKLYNEKFTDIFKHFCINEKFGIPIQEGLLLSEELASFYMTFLAEEIAYNKQASPITDLTELDELSTLLRTKNLNAESYLNAAKTIINFYLPDTIENIEIEKLIEFRNDSGIKDLRNSFNKTVESFYESVEGNFDPYTYIKNLNQINKDLVREMIIFFGSAAAFILNCTLVTDSSTAEIAAKTIEGALVVVSSNGINSQWKLGKDRRNARKFLSKVRKI